MTTRAAASRPTARTAGAATALGALLLLTACGGDDAASAPTTSTATSGATSGATTSAPSTSPSATSATSSATSATGGVDARDPEAELEVEDQRGDGSSVAVEEVRLSAGDGWVVITGPDDAVLGSAAVARSDAEAPLTVPLDVAVTGGPEVRLVATLRLDDGDGALDPALDPVVVDEDRQGDEGSVDEDDLVRDAFDYRVG